MTLEFLQSEEDIREFVGYVYDRGYLLTRRCGPKQGTPLDRDAAISMLAHNLYMGWGTYLIGTAERPKILSLDSCGPEAHPSRLGNWGRIAGRIAHYDRDDPEEKALMKLLRSYFRKHCKFQRYNGAARMSCHFGPHYLELEAAYFADPRHDGLCLGYLFLLCRPGQADQKIRQVAAVLGTLDIQDVRITALPYWDDPRLSALHVPFLYHAPAFSETEYAAVLSALSDGEQPMRFYSGGAIRGFRNIRTAKEPLCPEDAVYVDVRLQRPW